MFRKLISSFILIVFMSDMTFASDVFRGYIEKTTEPQHNSELYTGEIHVIEKENVVKMTVSQVIDGSFSVEGDEFFAQITDDVEAGDGIIIPAGSVAHGLINQKTDAKRLGRNGWVDLAFDYIVTPDGNNIPIQGRISTKEHPVIETGKIIATDVGYTAAGGVIGGLFALQLFGLEAAIASQGYTVAGGAAVGGTIGLGMSLYRKGKDVLISPGDEIKVKILSSVELPVYREDALQQQEINYPGLGIRISNILYEKDPFGEVNTITLSIAISNMSDKSFSGMDLALVSDYNTVYNPSIFGDTKLIFSQFAPGDRKAGKISFSVDNVKQTYWLVVNDRGKNKPIAKVSLDNAYKHVSKDVKKRNAKIKKHKKNYYKESDPFEG